MKHKIVISLKDGHVDHVMTSGDTEVVIIEKTPQIEAISLIEPDFIFTVGKAHEAYMGKTRKFLQKLKF